MSRAARSAAQPASPEITALREIPPEVLLAEVSWRLRQYLAGNLRAWRESAGLSVTDAARAAGISVQHLSNIECESSGASSETLAALAPVYGCGHVTDLWKAPAMKRAAKAA